MTTQYSNILRFRISLYLCGILFTSPYHAVFILTQFSTHPKILSLMFPSLIILYIYVFNFLHYYRFKTKKEQKKSSLGSYNPPLFTKWIQRSVFAKKSATSLLSPCSFHEFNCFTNTPAAIFLPAFIFSYFFNRAKGMYPEIYRIACTSSLINACCVWVPVLSSPFMLDLSTLFLFFVIASKYFLVPILHWPKLLRLCLACPTWSSGSLLPSAGSRRNACSGHELCEAECTWVLVLALVLWKTKW